MDGVKMEWVDEENGVRRRNEKMERNKKKMGKKIC